MPTIFYDQDYCCQWRRSFWDVHP